MFSEKKYYEKYKKVRNKFRKYKVESLTEMLLTYLHRPEKDSIAYLKKHPWLCLLLMKWILIDNDNRGNKRIIDSVNADKLLNATYDLSDSIRMPNEYDHHILFFRNIAFQQFIFQHEFSGAHISRQFLLFADLPDNHLIKTKFFQLTNLTIEKFLYLSLVTITKIISANEYSISISWFASLKSICSEVDVETYLNLLSNDLYELKDIMKINDNSRRLSSEYYEQSPFVEFPFLKINNKYICIEKYILYRCIENFVYDKLRKWDSQRFMDKFGRVFENYINRNIDNMGLPYYTENDLRTLVGNNQSSLVDFIIVDNESNIFVDAKAVEMSPKGKITHLSDVVRNSTKTSIIKAIEQSHGINDYINTNKINYQKLRSRSNNFLLVITYKELYLGNGVTFHEAIAKEKINEIYEKYPKSTHIPLENMYFLTVEEFDVFSEAIKSNQIGLVEGLEKAKLADSDASSRKFDFHLHLNTFLSKSETPSYLKNRLAQVFASIISDI